MNYHPRGLREAAAPAPVRFALAHRIPLVWLGGLPIAAIDRVNSADFMLNVALARRGAGGSPPLITSANGQVLSMCARDPQIRDLFEAADLIHADGAPLVFASRLRSRLPLPERVATTDLFHDVAARAESVNATFYLLGATPEIVARAAENVRSRYSRLTVVGYRSGYFSAEDEKEVVAEINAAQPDILWVGMGAPAEQRFCLRNQARLSNVGVIKTSGGLFDFVSGKNRRAPGWLQAIGLEWAYRMALEPRRLAYRYLTTNPHAAYLLLTSPPAGPARAEIGFAKTTGANEIDPVLTHKP
jgi:N-acetylglucosaminyldiphosphoundecaprenol N-acetyl-beta-D-mannosaminyltransferase